MGARMNGTDSRPNSALRRSYQFHVKHSACLVGRHAEAAIALARAELEAASRGWYVEWSDDLGSRHEGPREWGWEEADIKRWERSEHECLLAMLRDEEGAILACLGGIWDPDRNYRRTVEAELASEALSRLNQ